MDPIEKLINEKLNKLVTSEYCELCDVMIDNNKSTEIAHLRGKTHCYNLNWFREKERLQLSDQKNNYVAPSEPIEKTKLFCKPCSETIGSQDELFKHNGTGTHQRNVDCYCELCSIYTPSKDHMWQHLKGKQHKEKLKEKGCIPIDGKYSPFCSSLLNALKNLMLVDICKVCYVELPNIKRCVTHYISESHGLKVEKWLQFKPNQESVNQSEPAEKVTDESKSEEKDINEVVETNVEYYCFICKLHFASKDRHQHVNTFPHSILCREKQELLKKGISEVYLKESQGSIMCTLCNITLYNFPVLINHTNSSKHIRNYLDWFRTVEKASYFQDSNIKQFYCKICNEELDGTSYADRHYEEESHTKNYDLFCKICEVSNATSEMLELHNKSTLHLENVLSKDIPIITTRPPKFPALIVPKNYTDIIDNGSSASPAETALKSSTSSNNDEETNKAAKNDQMVEEKFATRTNYLEFSCYICDVLLLSKKEMDLHVQSFQHSVISEEKERLLKEGISDEYLRASADGVICKLCSVTLCNPIGLSQHKNGAKHSNEYFKWRVNAKKVTTESEIEPFYCKYSDHDFDETSDETSSIDQPYTDKYSKKFGPCSNCNIPNATEELHNKSPLHFENEQKNNPNSDLLTISYTDFVTLLSTNYYCDNIINKTEENSGSSSISTTDIKDQENLKIEVFKELKKLVQKLYYSKQVPYDFGLKYLQKINKEVDEIIDDKEKLDFSNELDACFSNENETTFNDEYTKPHCKNVEVVDSKIMPEEEFYNTDVETFNQNPDKTNFEDKPQYISDLLNEIIDRKQEVVEIVEKDILSEIECLLEKIDNIEDEPVLEEIFKSLKGFNEELEIDASIQEINSCARKKIDEIIAVEKPSESKSGKLQQIENSANVYNYYPVLKTILDYGLCRFLPNKNQ